MKRSLYYSVFGWIVLGIAAVAVVLSAGEGIKAASFIASMISFLGADIAREFGK